MSGGPTSNDRTAQSVPTDSRSDALAADRRLDVELEHTFPASDPIPWIHDTARTRGGTLKER